VIRVRAGAGDAGTSKVNAVSAATSGRIDLTDNAMIVDYTTTSPAAAIRQLLTNGRNTNGNWQGVNGIGSSLASNSNGRAVGYAEASDLYASPGLFYGQDFDLTSILITFTLAGDATLDGAVNFADLTRLAQNYGATSGAVWSQGDFNYDGQVGFADLTLIAQNYGGSLLEAAAMVNESNGFGDGFTADFARAIALVPEPATLTAAAAATLLLLRRRGR
jgi:hypothetical protein